MTVSWLLLCGGTCSTVSVKTPNSWSSWWSTCANRWVLVEDLHPLSLWRSLTPLPVQVQFIDSLNGEDLLLTGEVRWRPLLEQNAQSILKVATPTYNDAGL